MIDVPKQNTPVMDADNPPLMSKPWWIALKNWVQAFNTLSAEPFVLAVRAVQADLAVLGPTLATGTLVDVTDYAHVLRWNGSAFQWGPGELGSGYFAPFAVSPTGSGWHLCDGTAGVTYLKADGTTGTLTMPNTAATPAYLRLGAAYSATITAAAVPTITSPTVTNPATTGSGTANIGAAGATAAALVTSPGTATATCNTTAHTHTDSGHTHTIANPTVGATTAALPADPIAHFPAPLWFRQ